MGSLLKNRFFGQLVLLIIIFANNSYSAAWLPKQGHSKILMQVEYNDKIVVDHDDFTLEKNSLSECIIEIERAIAEKFSLTYKLKTYKIIEQYYISDCGIYNKTNSNYFPSNFKSHNVGAKRLLYKNDNSVVSYQIMFEHLKSNRFQFENKLMYGHSFKYKNHFQFIDLSFAYLKSINSFNDAIKLDLTVGIRNSQDRLYLVQLLSNYQINFYDPISNQKVPLKRRYKEMRLQTSIVTKISDKLDIQQGPVR